MGERAGYNSAIVHCHLGWKGVGIRAPECLFEWECICLQPVEKSRRSEKTGIAVLRGMDMSVWTCQSSPHQLMYKRDLKTNR